MACTCFVGKRGIYTGLSLAAVLLRPCYLGPDARNPMTGEVCMGVLRYRLVGTRFQLVQSSQLFYPTVQKMK